VRLSLCLFPVVATVWSKRFVFIHFCFRQMHRQTVLVQMSFFSLDRLFSVLCGLEPSVDLRFFAVSRQTDRKTDHVRLFLRQTHRPTDRQSHFFLKQNPFRIEFGSLSVGGPCVNAAPLGTTNPQICPQIRRALSSRGADMGRLPSSRHIAIKVASSATERSTASL
jgi:hypothetical protein